MAKSPIKIDGTGLADTLSGTNGPDELYGRAGKDTLYGESGNDLLDGGLGADKMYGGEGDDTYIVNSGSDRVIESIDGGIDTVVATARFVLLGANVENLTFANFERHIGIGNELDNVITGSTGNDQINGRSGNDVLDGGGGKDLLLGGVGDDKLFGGNGDDQLRGGVGADYLDGGLGADYMLGGQGNDTYIVENRLDRVIETSNNGIDEVLSTVDFALSANVENLTLLGTNSTDGTGNRLNNVLKGNDQANILDGLGGNDTLDGAFGNDRLRGGEGADQFMFSTRLSNPSNVDIVYDFAHDDGDKFALSKSIFTELSGAKGLSSAEFYAAEGATRAVTDEQRIIYNTETGALYYDADGVGGAGAIQFADVGVNTHPTLIFTDFLLV